MEGIPDFEEDYHWESGSGLRAASRSDLAGQLQRARQALWLIALQLRGGK